MELRRVCWHISTSTKIRLSPDWEVWYRIPVCLYVGIEVTVSTEAVSNKRLVIDLKGINRRGQLRELPGNAHIGTIVKIRLSDKVLLTHITEICRARAPMLLSELQIENKCTNESLRLKPGWWRGLTFEQMNDFLKNWRNFAYVGNLNNKNAVFRSVPRSERGSELLRWPAERPFIETDWCKVWSVGAGESHGILICSNGIAVGILQERDCAGIVEVGPLDLNANRNLDFSPHYYGSRSIDSLPRWSGEVLPMLGKKVNEMLDSLGGFGIASARVPF